MGLNGSSGKTDDTTLRLSHRHADPLTRLSPLISSFPDALVEVGAYRRPTGPATSTARDLYRRVVEKLGDRRGGTSALAPKDRKELETGLFSDGAEGGLRGHAHRLLSDAYGDWIAGSGDSGMRVVLTMPTAPRELVSSWAADLSVPQADWGGNIGLSGPCVVAGLSKLVNRSHLGQVALRDAIAALSDRHDRLLLAVDSWTWRYLCHASDINLLPLDTKTLPAFGGDTLKSLIDEYGPSGCIRSVETGDDVRETGKNGSAKDPYLAMLAARAQGCPWAAMAQIEEAVSRADDEDEGGDKGDTDIWLAAPKTRHLPEKYAQAARFMLHALLIHDGISATDAQAELGFEGPSRLLCALERADLIAEQDGLWRCKRTAYPEIRRLLDEASFPLDAL